MSQIPYIYEGPVYTARPALYLAYSGIKISSKKKKKNHTGRLDQHDMLTRLHAHLKARLKLTPTHGDDEQRNVRLRSAGDHRRHERLVSWCVEDGVPPHDGLKVRAADFNRLDILVAAKMSTSAQALRRYGLTDSDADVETKSATRGNPSRLRSRARGESAEGVGTSDVDGIRKE